MRTRKAVGVVACIVVLLGIGALFLRRGARGQCEAYVREFESANGDQTLPYEQARWDHLKARADEGAAACRSLGMTTQAAALERVRAEVERQKASGEELGRNAAANAKRLDAERAWPDRQREVQAQLADATTKSSSGDWAGAGASLGLAQQHLDEMRGTSIEGTAPYMGLAKQADALRQRVTPHTAAIQAKEEAARVQQAASDALLGNEPIAGIDDCCLACRQYVQERMHDPDSFECSTSSRPRVDGARWAVDMAYRGKNALGAKVLTRSRFFLQRDQVVQMQAIPQ